MPITAADIKLLESEVMADTTDGGGRRTSRAIPDGVAGNIFPKVSRLDSVYGRVNLRKVYGVVQTADTDTYAGAHVAITDVPDNDKISVALFSTASDHDRRSAARDRIESYVTSGPESRMVLFGRQLAGQQNFMAYQRVEEPLPEIGDIYCLSNEPGGVMNYQQYVRIDSVDHEIRNFNDGTGEFSRRVVILGTGVPLRYEFTGPEDVSRYSTVARTSKVRSTTVVDAARYYGAQPLTEAASSGALTVKVNSVYAPLVPTTTRETPVSNAEMSISGTILPAAQDKLSETTSGWAVGQTRYTSRPITPGSLSIIGSGVGLTSDNSAGQIGDATFSATIDYESGAVTRTGGSAGSVSPALIYKPGGWVTSTVHTRHEMVGLHNRGTVYVYTLMPLPAPGSVFIDYRALGKWYRLRDRSDGTLSGDDSAYGIGTVDYSNGAVVVTLGALPDVETPVIMSWASPVSTAIRTNAASTPNIEVRAAHAPIARGSLAVQYVSGGSAKTANDDGNGKLIYLGTEVGSVNYNDGLVKIHLSVDSQTSVTLDYDYGDPLTYTFTDPSRSPDGSVTLTLPDAPVEPSSVRLEWNTDVELYETAVREIPRPAPTGPRTTVDPVFIAEDDGLGYLRLGDGTIVGTVNYTTGACMFSPDQTASIPVLNYGWVNIGGGMQRYQFTGFSYATAGCVAPPDFDVKASYRSTDTPTSVVETLTAEVKFLATKNFVDDIIPGSMMFSYRGRTYIDRSGTLFYGVDSSTGAGIAAGTVDYSTGQVTLTSWGAGGNLTMLACLTVYGDHTANSVAFRTPGAPLRPGSLYIQVMTIDGETISATCNSSGVISTQHMAGSVDQENGFVQVAFGEMVTAAGNEAEPWYRAENVVEGMIYKPLEIIPSTLRYNCVVLANLPLNADILGLDPVRLPTDGRVPIYRTGDVAVVHHTGTYTLPNDTQTGVAYSVGRGNLSEMWLQDANGTKVAADQYAVDLTAGTVTLAANFNLGTLVLPLVAKHRVEDMGLVTDVQINGQLTLASPLTRNYPAGSYVTSALLFGDMNARVTNTHDLLSFSTWTDTIGTGANAQYNNIDYPIEVLNNGAVTERWRINFTSTTAFQIVGENLGVIATGDTSTDCSPSNGLTGLPYFVIRASGWGAGWAAGNQLRFNTIGAAAPIWIARTILPGATLDGDSFALQVRGDVDEETV